MAKRDDIDQFNAIVEYSCMDHYYVLFKNFFANHLAHAQVGFLVTVVINESRFVARLDVIVKRRQLRLYSDVAYEHC